ERTRPLDRDVDTRSPEAVTITVAASRHLSSGGPGVDKGTSRSRHPARHHQHQERTAVTITAENPTQTADRRVLSYSPLPTPTEILGELPLGEAREALVERSRGAVAEVLAGRDDRLLVVVGPCSVHDTEAALDYAARLA